jgi:DUF4097 and DUF4098 domain-containing protein YvlB
MLAYALTALLAITQTDQTVPVQKGTRLDVSNFAGEVVIKVWDRDAVRVEVQHSDRETVDIRTADQRLVIRGRSRTGAARSLDYTISVPKWMAVSITGTYTDVRMDGVGGDVSVETTRGDVSVKGGSGFIALKSVQGDISLQGAKGKIEITNVNEAIHLADISGDVSAETTNGGITLDRIDSTNVDVYTVNGGISFDGQIRDKGAYRLTTHNGTIALAVPEKANATFSVRTYNGGFRSSFPVKTDDQNRRKRFTLTFGNGSARVEIESFNGAIVLRRPGEAAPQNRGRARARQQ